MSSNRRRSQTGFGYVVRKFGLSAFVVSTFAAYAVHEHLIGADANLALPDNNPSPNRQAASSLKTVSNLASFPASAVQTQPTAVPLTAVVPTDIPPTQVPPTDVPAPTSTPAGQYRDGTYTGPSVDAYYGNVQVQAVVQNGQIADVQFLDFPHDRRTSQRINSQATPWLSQEAIQAQSAQVDLISGATLTSEAFVESLSAALQSAKSAV